MNVKCFCSYSIYGCIVIILYDKKKWCRIKARFASSFTFIISFLMLVGHDLIQMLCFLHELIVCQKQHSSMEINKIELSLPNVSI